MDPDELAQYKGIKVNEERELAHKEGFGPHWDGHLEDKYKILKIWITSVARERGINPKTMDYDPETINVRVQSLKDPKFEHTIRIEHFL